MTTTTIPAPGTEVTIGGITYVVERTATAKDKRRVGHVNTADRMDRNDLLADVWLRRPRGRKFHQTWLRADGRWTALVSV